METLDSSFPLSPLFQAAKTTSVSKSPIVILSYIKISVVSSLLYTFSREFSSKPVTENPNWDDARGHVERSN